MASLWFYMTPQPPKPAMHDIILGRWIDIRLIGHPILSTLRPMARGCREWGGRLFWPNLWANQSGHQQWMHRRGQNPSGQWGRKSADQGIQVVLQVFWRARRQWDAVDMQKLVNREQRIFSNSNYDHHRDAPKIWPNGTEFELGAGLVQHLARRSAMSMCAGCLRG
jgi:hypothetical protein